MLKQDSQEALVHNTTSTNSRARVVMTGFSRFVKRRYVRAALILGILPILSVIVTCAVDGHFLWDVSILNSELNDELYYYKLVEGILHGGYPYGFFGYNESHANILSFAAWSPFLLLPWVLYGFVFGWHLYSPIVANILFMSLAMIAYGLLVKPSKKQIGVLTLLFFMFRPFARFMLSAMPEITCMSILIVFYGFYCHDVKTGSESQPKSKKNRDLVMMFVLSALLTLMRPYFGLLLLLPCIKWIRQKRLQGSVGSLLILLTVGLSYLLIQKMFTAAYFTPIYDTKWLQVFTEEGVLQGLHNILFKVYYQGKIFLSIIMEAIPSEDFAGAYFCAFAATTLILIIYSFSCWRSKQREAFYFHLYLTGCCLAMLFAIFLMYPSMQESSKHLLMFSALSIFVISNMKTRFYKKPVFVGVVFAFFFLYRVNDFYEYQIPYIDEATRERHLAWATIFDNQLELTKAPVPSYQNVVIWAFEAETTDGREQLEWQILYALPEGFGINCCMLNYLETQKENLQSRYIAVHADSNLDLLYQQSGYKEIGRKGDSVVYERPESMS
ncbi:MAG: hypothetical protein LBM69_00250 [Lachnospiraceae bacterium]|nr:hypothetical protein [Lachnospiraceae bacterium]